MSSIDERIVEMKFNNGQFEKGVSTTQKSLENLKKGLNLDASTKSLQGLDSAGKKFSLAGIANGIESISSKFSALSIVGITALTNIANKAVDAGLNVAKSLTVEPIMDGFREYELKMGSIQTILANTNKDGTTLKQVTASLDELNEYADQTIYNFGDMTRNIGLFTNAGIGIKDATAMIKGFSNEAASSGTTAQGAAGAAYQLSQALSSGKITLMDWKSLTNVGMGNKNMQTGIIEIADAMGTFKGTGTDATATAKDFNKSLEKGWLKADVMTNYLKIQAGELSTAQMKNLGLSDKQIKAFADQQKIAQDAATKVRTFTQLMGTLQEGVGSGWAQTFDILFGDFNEATEVFSNVEKVMSGIIGASSDARNELLSGWDKLGGRTVLINALSEGFYALKSVLTPIGEAMRDIFPPMTAQQLYNITVGLKTFIASLKMGETSSNNLKRTMRGVFAIFDIGWMIIKGFAGVLMDLFGVVQGGTGGFLNMTGNIGDFIVSVRDAIKNGEGLNKFFEVLGSVLKIPIELIKSFIGLLTGADIVGTIGGAADTIKEKYSPLKVLGAGLKAVWTGLVVAIKSVATFLGPLGTKLGDIFGTMWDGLTEGLQTMDFGKILDVINTALFGGLVLMLGKFMGNFKGDFVDGIKSLFKKGDEGDGGGFLSSIKEAFGGLTDTLGQMQATLKAATLMQIAIAVGVLTASVVALSKIDAGGLAKSMTAIGIMMGQLIGAMLLLDVATKGGGFLKLPIIASGMILLAIAIRILASSVKALSGLDWVELAKGLTGVGVALALLAGFTQIAKFNKGAVAMGAGIILLAVGLKILASAVKDFATISWADMAKGMTGVAAGLLIIAGAMQLMPKGMAAKAVGLVILGAALKIIASALKDFGGMTWEEIAKGLVTLAGSLVIIAGAMALMTGALPGAAALLIVSGALAILAPVLQSLGGMGWDEIGRGLTVLAGALLIIAGSLYLMSAALPGAAALVIVAAALALLAPVLTTFGEMSWAEIGAGLAMLAGTLLIIGAAGLLIIPALPGLLGLGAAILLIGVGALAAGVGMLAFSVGFTAVAVAAGVGTVAIVGMLTAIIGLIPMAMTQLGLGIIALATTISTGGVAITAAFTTVLTSLITAIGTVGPLIISTLISLIFMLVDTLVANVPRLVNAGFQLLIGILDGIANNIGKVVNSATNIIVNFINGISAGIPRIVNAGADLIISFLNSVANTIESRSGEMRSAGSRIGMAIVDGMTGGLASKARELAGKAAEIAKGALNAAKSFLGINSPSKEFFKLGKWSNEGMSKGLDKYASTSAKAGAGVGEGVLNAAKKTLEINSPSKAFQKLGKFVNQGFAKGLTGNKEDIQKAYDSMRDQLKGTMESTKKDMDKYSDRLKKLQKAKKQDSGEIAKAKKNLAQSKKENKAASSAHNELVKNLKDEKLQLEKLSKGYSKTAGSLDDAKKALEDARKTRDDYSKSVAGQFDNMVDISRTMKLDNYVEKMRKEISDVKAFASVIQNLRRLGLNDKMYQELISKGPEALPFARQILDGGKKSVKEVNGLASELGKQATKLGSTASKELYQAGVYAAEGLVKGLKNNEGAIAKQMDNIAKQMVTSMNNRLKIKSPSRVFMEVGKFSTEGLVRGLVRTSGNVEKASTMVAEGAVNSMKKALANTNALSIDSVDLSPRIQPVLDLSKVRDESKNIASLLNGKSLDIDRVTRYANGISEERRSQLTDNPSTVVEQKPSVISFVQNNHSPKAISEIDTYRNTHNQLAAAKGALTK